MPAQQILPCTQPQCCPDEHLQCDLAAVWLRAAHAVFPHCCPQRLGLPLRPATCVVAVPPGPRPSGFVLPVPLGERGILPADPCVLPAMLWRLLDGALCASRRSLRGSSDRLRCWGERKDCEWLDCERVFLAPPPCAAGSAHLRDHASSPDFLLPSHPPNWGPGQPKCNPIIR